MDLDLGDTRLIIATCKEYELLRNQAAYVLATAKWETAHTMKPVEEAFWLSDEWRRKNLRYYPWHGRGYVQLTWRQNYKRAAQELSVPLDREPELALDSHVAAKVLVKGCRDGWFTAKRLADYITLQRSDFKGARRIVNGTDKAAQIAALAREYDAALLAAGYGVENTPVAPNVSGEEFDTGPAADELIVKSDKPLGKSTTFWSTVGGFVTTTLTAISSLDWRVAAVVIVIAAAFAAWIIRERMIKSTLARKVV